jgi:cation diffusion facilitator family transporter
MQWVRKQSIDNNQKKTYRKAMGVTLAGNILLASSKAVVAYLSGSVALYADAANSISDVIYSVMMVWGLYVSQQPADRSHPQGHSRFEPIVGMLVTLSMTYAGFQAAKAAITRISEGAISIDPGLPTIILLVSAAVKLGMFFYIRNLAKILNSPTLRSASKDNVSDVATSAAAFLGAGLSSFVHPVLDPIAGLLVSAWIFKNAFEAGRENLGYLTGAGTTKEQCEAFVEVAKSVEGVQDVHHLMAEYVGPQLVLDMHINVDGNLSLNESHAIADQVIEALEALPDVDRAYIHVEPIGWQ